MGKQKKQERSAIVQISIGKKRKQHQVLEAQRQKSAEHTGAQIQDDLQIHVKAHGGILHRCFFHSITSCLLL